MQDATPHLVVAASDEDAGVRRAVVTALQQVQDARAIPGFVTLAADPDRAVRDSAIEGMTRAYLPTESGLAVTLNKVGAFFNPYADDWADVVTEPEYRASPAVIDALAARLADEEEALRIKAARSLGILRGSAGVAALVRALEDDRSNTVRFEAARALRKIGDPAAGPALIRMLGYTDGRVRNEVIFALGRLRYTEAVPELTRLYAREMAVPPRSVDRVARERLLGALAFIADPSSAGLFLIERTSRDDALAQHAYEGLARLADPAIAADIEAERAGARAVAVRTAQAWALYRMGRKEYLAPVIDALGLYRANRAAREYLLELRPAEVSDVLAYVQHGDSNVREGLAEVLGYVGDARAVPALRELSRDEHPQVAALATQALQRVEARSRS
jgi:HEAT repeat protein